MTKVTSKSLRVEIAKLEIGRGQRYPSELKARITTWAKAEHGPVQAGKSSGRSRRRWFRFDEDDTKRSAIDKRTAGTDGYTISLRIRKRVEEIFGWMKTVGNFRKVALRGYGQQSTHGNDGRNGIQPDSNRKSSCPTGVTMTIVATLFSATAKRRSRRGAQTAVLHQPVRGRISS